MRKIPKQQRSKEMVETLVSAASNALAERGFEGATMPVIAEIAGVSVGSLYQYFEDKDSLLEALVDRMSGEIATSLAALTLPENASLRESVELAIQGGYALLMTKRTYLELVKNWNRMRASRRAIEQMEQHQLRILRTFFVRNYRRYPILDLDVRLYVVINSVFFTIVRLVSDEQPLIRESDVLRGLVDMVTVYLETPSPELVGDVT